MRKPGGKTLYARFIALLVVGVMGFGCASVPDGQGESPTIWNLNGRALSAADIDVFIGDVAVEMTSYKIEPVDAPGTVVVVLGGGGDCPKVGNQVYSLRIYREKLGFPNGLHTSPWASDLEIGSCEVVEP